MNSVLTKTFTGQLVREWSSSPTGDDLGTHEYTMELFVHERGGQGLIEWDMPGIGETQHIGVWWGSSKELTDYDGVFSLPAEAIEVLEEYGLVVSSDFRN